MIATFVYENQIWLAPLYIYLLLEENSQAAMQALRTQKELSAVF